MRTKFAFIIAGAIASVVLYGQTIDGGPQTFQFAVAGGSENRMFSYTTIGGPVVTGRPYSATEERRSSQTLGDGTHIESSETNRLFRDELGRTRTERKDGNISIYDPVAGFSAELNPATKTATKMMVAVRAVYTTKNMEPMKAKIETLRTQLSEKEKQFTENSPEVRTIQNQLADLEKMTAEQRVTEIRPLPTMGGGEFYTRAVEVMTPVPVGGAIAGQSGRGGRGGGAAVSGEAGLTFTTEGGVAGPTVLRVNPGNNGAVDSLPAQMVNGILSQGTRTTETIPVGKIGNDRVISIVNERWYSSDLQMLIKSSSSDPRFGNSTYQLINILTTSPDPSLFQIPGDYTIKK